MGRGPKPAKGKAKPAVARKLPKNDAAKIPDLKKRLAEALKLRAETQEQQTATSDILRAISSSPMDLQPLLEGVVKSATRFCGAHDAELYRLHGTDLKVVAHHGPISAPMGRLIPVVRGTVAGRAALERQTVHVADLQAEPQEFPVGYALAREFGYRTVVSVPLLREGEPIGTINLRRTDVNPFTDAQIALLQIFADQAVIAIENVRLFNETKEALEQQTATSEILRVISSSPTDVQPVFDAIASTAVRLCESNYGVVHRFDGTNIGRPVAMCNVTDEQMALYQRVFPLAASMDNALGESALTRRTVQIEDTQAERRYTLDTEAVRVAREVLGYRTVLMVPMVRRDQALGIIAIWRREQRPFSPGQIALVETFADQAVIAIENVRLFKELQTSNHALTEALEQQTSTSDILRVISQSPTDVQPVLDAVAENAARLCDAQDVSILEATGGLFRVVAYHGASRLRDFEGTPVTRGSVAGRAILNGQLIHVHDITDESEAAFPVSKAIAQHFGHRTMLAVPLLREGTPIGTIFVRQTTVRPFTDAQIALLQTFADQAVIAIENVRLFKELEEKNSALTEALDRQTATAEVLRVISQSQTEVQPVFDAIVDNGMRLFRAWAASIAQVDGELLHTVAVRGGRPGLDQYLREQSPWSIHQPTPIARCIVQRTVIHVPDTELDRYADEAIREVRRRGGMRSILAAPMLRDGQPIGGIWISRAVAGPFSPAEIALLQTFADQAVIAIENARLLNELQASNREIAEKSRQIEVASQHKSEFLANMSHELRTPLNAIIGFSEVLSDRMFGELNEKQEEYLKDIYASGTHLLSLINDILDLSKIEAGRMELELTDFDLPTALDNALPLVRERAGRRSITLHTSIDERLGEVRADERKIRQVVLNLLSNAIKFTPEGGRIEVGAVSKDGFVEVSVSDTGVGIAPEDQEKVFEEFRQVGTADKKAEGTGLGLTLCRKFVELHGGRIWVKSQIGVGSTFTFTIPIRPRE